MSRVRSRNDDVSSKVSYNQTWNNHEPVGGEVLTGWQGTRSQITDDNHPFFREMQRRGDIILGNCDIWTWTRSYSPMSLVWSSSYPDAYYVAWEGDLAACIEPYHPRDTSAEAYVSQMGELALVKAYGKIRGSSLMSGEIASDIGRTIGMIRHPFRKAAEHLGMAVKSAARHYGKTARSVAKANASAWLEYRYGVKPLMLDASQAIKMASKTANSFKRSRLVVRSSEKIQRLNNQVFSDEPVQSLPWGWKVSGSVATNEAISMHAGVIYEIANRSPSQKLSEDLRLGSDSLAATAWEVMPFSFVADWFVNVGPWLEAMNLPPSVSVRGNWVTKRIDLIWITSVSSLTMHVDDFTGPRDIAGSGGSSKHMLKQSVRSVNQQLPTMPTVEVRWDSVLHATDGIALSLKPILGCLRKLFH